MCVLRCQLPTDRWRWGRQCIPLFADQRDLAVHIESAGAGLWLDKATFTADQLAQTTRLLLADADGALATNIRRLQSLVELAGGAPIAAKWVAHVAAHGVEGLLPPGRDATFIQSYQLDVCLAYAALIWAAVAGWRRCISARCCKEKTN